MDWLHVILLSLLSLPVGLTAVYGFFRSKAAEMVIWLLLGLGLAWALRTAPSPFLSAFICGLLMGLWQHLLNMALWNTYVAKNPKVAAQITEAATEKKMSPRMFMLVSAPMVGILYGVVIGLLAWGASRVFS